MKHIEVELLKTYFFDFLVKHNMDPTDYVGCFGFAHYGCYDSIEKLWSKIPYKEFMAYPERSKVMMDLERIVAATAFQLGLVTSLTDCSLCGDIFNYPNAFHSRYSNESFEEIQAHPYEGPAVKFWGGRWKAVT